LPRTAKNLVFPEQLLHRGSGARRLVAIVDGDEPELAAVYAAIGVRRRECRLDTELHVLPEFLGGAAEGCGNAKPNFTIGYPADGHGRFAWPTNIGELHWRSVLRGSRRSRLSDSRRRRRIRRSRRRVRFFRRFWIVEPRRELGGLYAGFPGERWKRDNDDSADEDSDHRGNDKPGHEPADPAGGLRHMNDFRFRAERLTQPR
jgi:hypothetical protein